MALENSMLVMNGKQVGGNTQDLTGYQTKVDNNLETESKEIAGAINELRSEKADTDIVAADFNVGTSYTAGNYCIYEGKFYKFKASHTGAWSAADVDEIKIAGELASLKSGLNGKIRGIISDTNVPCNIVSVGHYTDDNAYNVWTTHTYTFSEFTNIACVFLQVINNSLINDGVRHEVEVLGFTGNVLTYAIKGGWSSGVAGVSVMIVAVGA